MSFDLVLLGGTGDLAWRKLMPALFQAFRQGSLPEGGRIIGVGRDALGHDLASNRAINRSVCKVLGEKQVYRSDHYPGKPAVQNLFALRFGNALFEPLWRREHIANIQITIAEQLGVETRGAFCETTWALRDMVQNHTLQLLCAIGTEPPINAHADAIRDEKLKVLRSLKPWTQDTLATDMIRGQYAAGSIGAAAVPGYREEFGVNPDSHTETFVALRTEISNWRWAGVPFHIRTGKRRAGRDARIVVNFRPTPHASFNSHIGASNRLVINLQPRDGLELHLLAQGASIRRQQQQALSPVQLDLDFDQRFGSGRVGAYERLLLDVIDGRLNLFVRSDEQEEAWRWVEPVLQSWKNDRPRTQPPCCRHLGSQRLQRHDRARGLLLERRIMTQAEGKT